MEAKIRGAKDSITVSVPLIKYKRGDIYICYCPVLDLMTYSEDEKKLEGYIDETIRFFIERSIETNTLNIKLKKLGWKLSKGEISSPKQVNIPSNFWSDGIMSQKPVAIPCF